MKRQQSEIKGKQDETKEEKNEIRKTCKDMEKCRKCNDESKPTLEAVKNRIGAGEDQIRDMKTNSNSRTGRRVTRGGDRASTVLGSGKLLHVCVCPGGLVRARGVPFLFLSLIETVSVWGLEQDRAESIRQSATDLGTLLIGTPSGAWREV